MLRLVSWTTALLALGCTESTGDSAAPPSPRFTAVTFNVGTTLGLAHSSDGDDYGATQVAWSDDYYGNGLAWVPAIAAVKDWFAARRPEIVGFQEIFYSGECPEVPEKAREGFVCETWTDGDATVASEVLGPDYQVACHPGKSDKCVAVLRSFGSIRQCADPEFCLERLDGRGIDGCGSGARVARATVDLARGGELTVVHLHGTSGLSADDTNCRREQVRQVFVDMDGAPGANGARNVVLGDLNVDPGRVPGDDPSADEWDTFVGGEAPFQWVSEVGKNATPTYLGVFNIDHVISDAFTGSCEAPGVGGVPPVYENVLFDHVPIVCDLGDL